ncbi:hypothetical protein BJ322DRAFT_1125250 [Thelephora terrestris]|uniref:Uncharacterized protein n=1 Tax=Thelephora terrestris TaxID=56493 RepID=A0A9P6L619_9AGAM|nr:hypothetical protein BJ322DRAFT_1125250 [Thelephora terrestris]
MQNFYEEEAQRRTQRFRTTEKRLEQTEELLATRSAELTGAQAFLSTADRLSEAEVLDIVRDLNENIYQVAVNLTEGWEKSQSSQATNSVNVDSAPLAHVPALAQLARNRDPVGLTFQLQSCFCYQVARMTSRWAHYPELIPFGSVYQRLSDSEGQAVSAGWRSLTHTYLSLPPPHSAPLVEELANILDETGSFSSKEQSLELVEALALGGIESIIRIALRLECAFMKDVSSSDMSLLFETPGTAFDSARMVNEFEPNGSPANPDQGDGVAGVTELGVGRSVCGGPGQTRRVDVLLKTKVVLEKDVMGSGMPESRDSDID